MTESPDTRLLRAGSESEYARLRELLTGRGLDPDAVALAEFFPDDGHLLFGIVVTPDDRVFEFDFELGAGAGDARTRLASATLSAWEETTGSWRERPFSESVATAREWLGLDTSALPPTDG